jgi:hypothetical protein
MQRLQGYIKDIGRAQHFNIQNVSDYFWEHDKEFWDIKDLTVAPPFNFFTMSYTMPDSVYSKSKGRTVFDEELKDARIMTVFRVVEKPTVRQDNSLFISLTGESFSGDPRFIPGTKWMLDIQMFGRQRGKLIHMCDWFLCVDDLGRVMKQKNGDSAFWGTAVGSSPDTMSIVPTAFLHVPCLALTFLSCKNCKLIPPYPTKKRRVKRKEKGETKYYTLKVIAMGETKRSDSRGGKTRIKQSAHIVAGHFREYGPEYGKKKMFGKISGRFWIPAHMSGSEKVGQVHKTYKVE